MKDGAVYQWQTVGKHGARDSHRQDVGSNPTSPTCTLCGKKLVVKSIDGHDFLTCPVALAAPPDSRAYFALFSGHTCGLVFNSTTVILTTQK